MFAYVGIIREEIATFKKGNVAYVQFAAPSVVARFKEPPLAPDELELISDAVKSAVKKTGVESRYFSYFGDAGPYLPDLFVKIPAGDIGPDFTTGITYSFPNYPAVNFYMNLAQEFMA